MSYFVDTNIFVYAHDRSEPEKQALAIEFLQLLSDRSDVYISTQVLAETFRIITLKIASPLSVKIAQKQIEGMRALFNVLPVQEESIVEAIRGLVSHKMSYWDAQIWATARLNNIKTIFTEDIQSSGAIESVRFVNPFSKNFDLLSFI